VSSAYFLGAILPASKNTKVVATGIVTALMLLVIFSAGEVALGLWHLKKYGVAGSGGFPVGSTFDEELGWRATNDYREQLEGKTAGGKRYLISRSQDERGFRLFGNLNSERPKLLVIGDSFTQAIDVSDDKTYYAVLKTLLDIEIFAYGAGGYGTLQEYMVLDRYVDLIKPDLLLWQYCSNDFINNDPMLELLSRVNNNGVRRPYWLNNRIVYQVPKESLSRFRDWSYRYSLFFTMIFTRLDKLTVLVLGDTVEGMIEKEGLNHQGFARAVAITDDLMGRVRSRVGSLPIVAFSCNTQEPYTDALKRISSHQGIIFLDDVAESVQVAKDRGDDVFVSDKAHLNELGNFLVGKTIAVHLSKFIRRPTATASR
jgi:hypothetical protein